MKAVAADNCYYLEDLKKNQMGMYVLPELSAAVWSRFRIISGILFRINTKRTMRKQRDSRMPSQVILQNFAESRKYRINSVRWASF